jgi:hypothetical protein
MISALFIGAVPATVDLLQDAKHGRDVAGEITLLFPFWFDVNRLIQIQSLLLVDEVHLRGMTLLAHVSGAPHSQWSRRPSKLLG